MKYHNITKDDMNNGDGLRVVLWVSGCSHHCEGCQNPETWNPEDGLEFDDEARFEIFHELSKDYVSGITFSGGDPLHHDNIREVVQLMHHIKTAFPDNTIWVYTGYLWEAVKKVEVLTRYIDVLVDGKFVQELQDNNAHWVGSTNQRVIDVQQSLKEGKVIIHGSDY